MSGHTKEPWKLIWHGNEKYPYPLSVHTEDDAMWIVRDGVVSSGANARRIVACVNACQGLSDSALDAGVVDRVREALQELTDDLERRYAEKDRGSRNYLGDVVGKANKEELAAMSEQLSRARAALALLRESE